MIEITLKRQFNDSLKIKYYEKNKKLNLYSFLI